jgi:predicted nucleotidyltransferase
MIVEKDFLDFFKALTKNNVEYLVIGGYALMAHERPRYTGDLDIWINPKVENAERIVQAIDDFGFGSLKVTKEDFLSQNYFIQIGYEPVRIDVTADISGVTFDEAYPRRKVIDISGLPVPFIGIHELIKNKLASGRDQDLPDAKKLKKKLGEE